MEHGSNTKTKENITERKKKIGSWILMSHKPHSHLQATRKEEEATGEEKKKKTSTTNSNNETNKNVEQKEIKGEEEGNH